jgi:predicted RNase H-like HicB family nuclease
MNLPISTTVKNEITVTLMLEPQASGLFVASAVEFPACRVEAATREDAIALVSDCLQAQLDHVELVPLNLSLPDRPQAESPWKPLFGLYQDVPAYEDVMAIIQADRDAMGDEDIDPGFYMPRESEL